MNTINSSRSIIVKGVEVHLCKQNDEDYISLTDMAKNFHGGEQLIKNWLQNKNTLEFLGVWEQLNNPNFNLVEFHQIKIEAGTNRFIMSAKQWIQKTRGIGLIAKAGRYGGSFAHKDIAFEFGSWLSPEFKLYLIKEFQRLKEQEADVNRLEWSVRRLLTKANYQLHTDTIQTHLIPPDISKRKKNLVFASEADVLNLALFGITAKEWRSKNPNKEGNIRDYATVEQLVVLASLESQNVLLIVQGYSQEDRLEILNQLAITQMQSLMNNRAVQKLTILSSSEKSQRLLTKS